MALTIMFYRKLFPQLTQLAYFFSNPRLMFSFRETPGRVIQGRHPLRFPAADPLESFDASGASFLPLTDGEGDTHLSCLHLETGGKIEAPSLSHATALLIVYGHE